ncbi:MAG: hypothetical protein ACHQFX_14640 [Chitinophagales bacterium]
MITICFYTADSYEVLKKVADDKKALCDTYVDWLVEFSKAVEGFKGQGLEVVPININIGELTKWCKKNKSKNTSHSRSQYVADVGHSQFSGFE